MPAGDRVVIVERFPDRLPGQYSTRDLGEVDVIARLSPTQPDPTDEQLAQMASVYSRYGGYATCRMIAWWWTGWPRYTPEQMRALAGLP